MVNNYLTKEKFLVASIRINIKLSLRRTLQCLDLNGEA